MSEIKLPVNSEFTSQPLSIGLILIDVLNIPHLCFFSGDHTFSLTVNCITEKNTSELLNSLKRKKIPSVVIELSNSIDQHKVRSVFSRFDRATSSVTCIEPVKLILSILYDDQFSDCVFVYSIVERLLECNRVVRSYGININEVLTFTKYSREDVNNAILAHQKKSQNRYVVER
jgi:hypothetical protein